MADGLDISRYLGEHVDAIRSTLPDERFGLVSSSYPIPPGWPEWLVTVKEAVEEYNGEGKRRLTTWRDAETRERCIAEARQRGKRIVQIQDWWMNPDGGVPVKFYGYHLTHHHEALKHEWIYIYERLNLDGERTGYVPVVELMVGLDGCCERAGIARGYSGSVPCPGPDSGDTPRPVSQDCPRLFLEEL
jgi:hypothetical protein